jgi:hypothetical protein
MTSLVFAHSIGLEAMCITQNEALAQSVASAALPNDDDPCHLKGKSGGESVTPRAPERMHGRDSGADEAEETFVRQSTLEMGRRQHCQSAPGLAADGRSLVRDP